MESILIHQNDFEVAISLRYDALRVYLAICKCYAPQAGQNFRYDAVAIARIAACSKKTVQNCIVVLCDAGLFRRLSDIKEHLCKLDPVPHTGEDRLNSSEAVPHIGEDRGTSAPAHAQDSNIINIIRKEKESKESNASRFFSEISKEEVWREVAAPTIFEHPLFDGVDRESEAYRRRRAEAFAMYREKNISDDLIDVIVAGSLKNLPGFSRDALAVEYSLATDIVKQNDENNRKPGVKQFTRYRWQSLAKYVYDTLLKQGYQKPPVRKPSEIAEQRGNEARSRRRRERLETPLISPDEPTNLTLAETATISGDPPAETTSTSRPLAPQKAVQVSDSRESGGENARMKARFPFLFG